MGKRRIKKAEPPQVIVLAGPNGAGKTTASQRVLRDALRLVEFVNADIIAQGLSGFAPESAAIEAGRIVLERIDALSAAGRSFAFETTLASRSFAPRIRRLQADGYEFRLLFFWLPNPEMAVSRVARRVASGGHDVPAETIRRRYNGGLKNLFELYIPLAQTWQVYDSSVEPEPGLIAHGAGSQTPVVLDPAKWSAVLRGAGYGA